MMAGLDLSAGRCRQPLRRMCAESVQIVRHALLQIQGQSPDLFEPLTAFFDVDVEAQLHNDEV